MSGAGDDPEANALLAAAVELAGVVRRQVDVRRADVAGVAHRLAVLLLAEDLVDVRMRLGPISCRISAAGRIPDGISLLCHDEASSPEAGMVRRHSIERITSTKPSEW